MFLLCASFADAQSVRRKLTDRVAPSPSLRAYVDSMQKRDIDIFVGRVVRVDGEYAIVYVMSPSVIRERVPVYYACDERMRPTALLQNQKISHRACSTFKVSKGEVRIGDTVMVKYLAPKSES